MLMRNAYFVTLVTLVTVTAMKQLKCVETISVVPLSKYEELTHEGQRGRPIDTRPQISDTTRSKARTVFARSVTGIVGSNPT
jgi:hypothetical protein